MIARKWRRDSTLPTLGLSQLANVDDRYNTICTKVLFRNDDLDGARHAFTTAVDASNRIRRRGLLVH